MDCLPIEKTKKNYFEKIKIMKRGKLTSPLGVYGGGSTLYR